MSFALGRPCARASRQLLSTTARAFSTTPYALNGYVPPESPSYIRLPTPPQSEEKKPVRVRGHLPVPREIFPRADGDRKTTPEYLQQTAPKPARQLPPKNKSQLWKSKIAEARRENLKRGLNNLWDRRNLRDSIRNTRVRRKFNEHNEALRAPEREDDRLTRSTVLDSIFDTTVYPDPERFNRAEESKVKVKVMEETKREARRDALMELYINASNFIVTEQELKAEIDSVFADDFFRRQGQAVGRYAISENAWDVHGKPPTVMSMVEATSGKSTKVMDFYESEYDRSVKRQKRIAEEFTGGKME